jgi:hypothetical protein
MLVRAIVVPVVTEFVPGAYFDSDYFVAAKNYYSCIFFP